MPSLIESVSPFRIAAGIGVAALTVALSVFDFYTPSSIVAVSIVFLLLVVTLRGLKPFGDTVGYRLLQAGAFTVWGITVLVFEETLVIPVIFIVLGSIGILYYGWKGNQKGIWTPVSQ
jgi:hypothetical protein